MRVMLLSLMSCLLFGLSAHAEVPKTPKQAAVVSAHPLATQVGLDILAQGGNAFDAAVAVSAMLCVVEPFSSGIGGGGFWLSYDSKTDNYRVLDSREVAPMAATPDMYLDDNGDVIQGASTVGPLSAAIPGMPASFVKMNDQYGSLSLETVLAPAIKAAREGFPVDARYVRGAKHKKDILLKNEDAVRIFLNNGEVPKEGWILKQPDLANTINLIAKKGMSGFYDGEIAIQMVADVTDNGGIWSLDDLRGYHVVERSPVVTTYKNARIIMPPLPSSGGLVLSNIFNILSGYDLNTHTSSDQKHIILEAMRHGYYNRALYMGDSDFVTVPVRKILSQDMAYQQRQKISFDKAYPSTSMPLAHSKNTEGNDTTHFAVIDENGNRVAVTQSLNFWAGSGFVPKGTGVLLNNQMDDFTIKSGVENGYGLLGTKANAIAPEKRMLSSMTPTFVETDAGMMMMGTPGGSRIISMNLLGILNFMNGKSADEIVKAPRYHHQYMPDVVVYEKGALSEAEMTDLKAKEHTLKESERGYGNMQVIVWNYKTGTISTASDPRGKGAGRVY